MTGPITGRIYLDSNIFIYTTEGSSRYEAALDGLFLAFESLALSPVTSELSLGECLIGARSDELADTYASLIANNRLMTLLPITRGLLFEAAALGRNWNLKLPDAIHAATAIGAQCETFLTNDTRLRLPDEVRKLTLDDLAEIYSSRL